MSCLEDEISNSAISTLDLFIIIAVRFFRGCFSIFTLTRSRDPTELFWDLVDLFGECRGKCWRDRMVLLMRPYFMAHSCFPLDWCYSGVSIHRITQVSKFSTVLCWYPENVLRILYQSQLTPSLNEPFLLFCGSHFPLNLRYCSDSSTVRSSTGCVSSRNMAQRNLCWRPSTWSIRTREGLRGLWLDGIIPHRP